MKTYTFTHTRANGESVVYTIEAENLTAALKIYRQRVREDNL